MTKIPAKIYVLLLLSVLASCKVSKPGGEEAYRRTDKLKAPLQVSLEPGEDVFVFSDHFSSGRMIGLSGCRIGRISGVFPLDDGRIVVSASDILPDEGSAVSSCVALFSEDGKFLSHWVKIGNGPEEVVNVQDVKLNPWRHTLDVLSDFGRTIVRYDMESLKRIESVPVDAEEIVSGESFLPLDYERVLIYKNLGFREEREYKVYLCDASTGRVQERYLPFDKQTAETLGSFGQSNMLSRNAGKIFFSEVFMETIYQYADGALIPYVGFRDNRYSLPEELLHSGFEYDDLKKAAAESSKIYFHGSFYPVAGRFYSRFCYREHFYLNEMIPDRGESHAYRFLQDDLCSGIGASCDEHRFRIVGSDADRLFFVLETEGNTSLLILTTME